MPDIDKLVELDLDKMPPELQKMMTLAIGAMAIFDCPKEASAALLTLATFFGASSGIPASDLGVYAKDYHNKIREQMKQLAANNDANDQFSDLPLPRDAKGNIKWAE